LKIVGATPEDFNSVLISLRSQFTNPAALQRDVVEATGKAKGPDRSGPLLLVRLVMK
jgi:hypothetical protein